MALNRRILTNRRSFRKRYSSRTASIVQACIMPRPYACSLSEEIADRMNNRWNNSTYTTQGTVAATLAHLTRGTYTPYVEVTDQDELVGSCDY